MNPETHPGILAAAPASSQIPLLSSLAHPSLASSVSPTKHCEGCRPGAMEAVVGRTRTSLPTPSLLLFATRVTGRGVWGLSPLSHPQDALGGLLSPAEWPGVQPRPRPRPGAPSSAPLPAPRHLAVPPFRKHLLRAHCELEPRQPSLPAPPPCQQRSPPPAPSLPDRPVGFVTAAAKAQAPRERPQRSRRMAGSDTDLPGGSRGSGGWRPLKRDRCRPAELADLRGGGEDPWAGWCPSH